MASTDRLGFTTEPLSPGVPPVRTARPGNGHCGGQRAVNSPWIGATELRGLERLGARQQNGGVLKNGRPGWASRFSRVGGGARHWPIVGGQGCDDHEVEAAAALRHGPRGGSGNPETETPDGASRTPICTPVAMG
jgi:hypothetical protein